MGCVQRGGEEDWLHCRTNGGSNLSQYLLQAISMMMVGHLGEFSLSSTAIATSLTNVTGFSLLEGMASELETLCGQAYGARQFEKLGNYTFSAVISLVWDGSGNLPGSFCNLYLVIFLILYIKFSSSCEKTRVPVSMEALKAMGEFIWLVVPSNIMICLEWWSFEVVILLSGIFPNPQLQTSVLSICTRVSNELGAGNPEGARVAVYTVMFVALIGTTIVSTALFASRNSLGYAYSDEKEVIDYVTEMVPLVCLSIVFDIYKVFYQAIRAKERTFEASI
ncbi:hypothetical protein IFM89_005031 [Coptis chinensis]|uniref:Uncharacterized protein n=1 Tax=Coptis chinensis TaxID=261450 RepID=A0A835HKZ2_9MAGN|nr:hypothetical protein IFM89_005031 [Coptis chinensis]